MQCGLLEDREVSIGIGGHMVKSVAYYNRGVLGDNRNGTSKLSESQVDIFMAGAVALEITEKDSIIVDQEVKELTQWY